MSAVITKRAQDSTRARLIAQTLFCVLPARRVARRGHQAGDLAQRFEMVVRQFDFGRAETYGGAPRFGKRDEAGVRERQTHLLDGHFALAVLGEILLAADLRQGAAIGEDGQIVRVAVARLFGSGDEIDVYRRRRAQAIVLIKEGGAHVQPVAERVRVLKRRLHPSGARIKARHDQRAVMKGRRRRRGAEFLSESGS